MNINTRLRALKKHFDSKASQLQAGDQAQMRAAVSKMTDAEIDAEIERAVSRYELENGPVEPTPISLVGEHIARMYQDDLSESEMAALCKQGMLIGGEEEVRLYGAYLDSLPPDQRVKMQRKQIGG